MSCCEVVVHGTLKRTERLERAVARVIVEVRKHENEQKIQNQKVQSNMVG